LAPRKYVQKASTSRCDDVDAVCLELKVPGVYESIGHNQGATLATIYAALNETEGNFLLLIFVPEEVTDVGAGLKL
jgi:hypothetical protein